MEAKSLEQTIKEDVFAPGDAATGQSKNIFAALNAVMRELRAISKDRKNTAQSYNFRGIDDVYNALNPLFAKHGIITVPTVKSDRHEERQSAKGATLIYRVLTINYRFYALDGSFVDALLIGEGMDSGDKASNKAMAAAHKYALLQVLAIPTEEQKDSENDSHDVGPSDDIYQGKDDQKQHFREVFSGYSVLTGQDKAQIADKMRNRPMRELEGEIIAYLGAKK